MIDVEAFNAQGHCFIAHLSTWFYRLFEIGLCYVEIANPDEFRPAAYEQKKSMSCA